MDDNKIFDKQVRKWNRVFGTSLHSGSNGLGTYIWWLYHAIQIQMKRPLRELLLAWRSGKEQWFSWPCSLGLNPLYAISLHMCGFLPTCVGFLLVCVDTFPTWVSCPLMLVRTLSLVQGPPWMGYLIRKWSKSNHWSTITVQFTFHGTNMICRCLIEKDNILFT